MTAPAWWLLKTEPGEFAIGDLARRGRAPWDGVRNYQARNHLRTMRAGDRAFIYHSSCRPPGIAGVATVARTAFPDPAQWDASSPYHDPGSSRGQPRWDAVEVAFERAFPALLTLDALRAETALAGMVLFGRGRLSVQPVTPAQARHILAMVGA